MSEYCTSYHQDVHVPPHFTLYNQAQGVSLFHFLPLLVGLFATHVARKRDVTEVSQLLSKLEEMKIGRIGEVGPGNVILVSISFFCLLCFRAT